MPHRLDYNHLVPVETIERDGVTMLRLPEHHWRRREGFALTDAGMNTQQALDQINYCIWCHTQGKDSCSTGLKDRKTGEFQKSPFGVTLAGCPLDEKISEMHTLRAQGSVLGAFATIAIDNPMMAATGHRICNDCMKSCIYQRQDPVDIPQAETSILKDVLGLPWGFEIYALLTRWNPLDIRRPLPRPDSGRKVLIVGLGPAGFTLAHHLMNDGHTVVAIDGLKIEPLGFDPTAPVRDAEQLFENLDDRVMAGFGGVAEYGITVRWNKNYLKLVRLLLERRRQFAHFGGIRFGGGATLAMDDAWAMGFDHIALCMGAGKPTVLDIPNGLARGVRAASDFLMALQLTGAAKFSSIANLQVRLPVVVIGGGLTAIDTATESLAYYVRQVEKFAARYRTLVAERGEAAVRAAWNAEEAGIADEFLAHAAAIQAEREAATREGRTPRVARLLDAWGGATIAYRRRLIDSPSYTLNHEEVAKALEEAVRFAEGLTPRAVEVDGFGHAAGLRVSRADGSEVVLPARAILVAAGTQPNTVLAREDGRIQLDGRYFQAVDETGAPVTVVRGLAKPDATQVLMHRADNGRFISFFGDLHPSFFGNVVKAMGGAKRGYPVVSRALAAQAATEMTGADLIARCRRDLVPTVHCGASADADHRRGGGACAGPGARLPSGPVLPVAELRDAGAAHRRGGRGEHRAGDGRAGDDRRLDRSGAGTGVGDRAGDGRQFRHLRPAEAGRAGGADGPDRDADRDPRRCDRRPGRRRAGQRGAVLDRCGAAGGWVARDLLRRLQADARPLQGGGDRARRRCHRLVLRRGAGLRADAAAGPQLRRQHRAGHGGVWRRRLATAGGGPHDRHRLGPHDAGGRRGAARRAGAVAEAGPHRDRLDQLADAMHDEGGLRPVPAAADRSGDRRADVVFSCFNQDQALDRVDFPALHERLAQNGAQEKLTAQWIDRALRRLHARGVAAVTPPLPSSRKGRGVATNVTLLLLRERVGGGELQLVRRLHRPPGGRSRSACRHHLAANFAALVGRGVDIHVPLARLQIRHLRVGQGHRTGHRAGRAGAADRHRHTGIRPWCRRPMEMRRRRRAAQAHEGDRVAQLLAAGVQRRKRVTAASRGGGRHLGLAVHRCMEVQHRGRGGRQKADGEDRGQN